MKKQKVISGILAVLVFVFIVGCAKTETFQADEQQEISYESNKVQNVDINTSETNLEEIKLSRDTIITLGALVGLKELQKTVDSFNNTQDKIWIDLYKYNSYSELLLDISRKQGTDIYYMEFMDLVSLAEKGVIEELTPFFDSSEVVKREDIIESIWRAGSVGTGMYYVIPRFRPSVLLVEKGYTDGGIWSIEDYFKLAEKYPDAMVSDYVTEPRNMMLNDVRMSIDSFINWEDRSCSFDSVEFVKLLKQLKAYSEKPYASTEEYTVAERLEQKLLLTKKINLTWFPYMTDYKDIRDSLLGFCEIAGMPNEEGILKYSMNYREIYGINAGSENKEAAWTFFEYILSKDYQESLNEMFSGGDGRFTCRRDVLNAALDKEIGLQPEGIYIHTNSYTGEEVVGTSEFSEQDKMMIMSIVENCYCDYTVSCGRIDEILVEEMDYYFEGAKSAEEVAKIIHNRVSLYLME